MALALFGGLPKPKKQVRGVFIYGRTLGKRERMGSKKTTGTITCEGKRSRSVSVRECFCRQFLRSFSDDIGALMRMSVDVARFFRYWSVDFARYWSVDRVGGASIFRCQSENWRFGLISLSAFWTSPVAQNPLSIYTFFSRISSSD